MISIAVIGRAQQPDEGPVPPRTLAAAYTVGRVIAEGGAAVVTGGMSGVMEAASQGAKEAGGLTIGILASGDRTAANAYVDVPIATGLGMTRNLIYPRGCDAVVMVGGGVGTLNELTIAYQFGTPIVVVEGTGGWADRLRPALIDQAFLDERRTVLIRFLSDPEAAGRLALELARMPLTETARRARQIAAGG